MAPPFTRRLTRTTSPVTALSVVQLEDRTTPAVPLSPIQHIVVVYQENWSFDGLYGSFPGANGLQNATPSNTTQRDSTGRVYTSTPAPLDSTGGPDPRFPPTNGQPALPVGPFNLSQFISPNSLTGDINHQFYSEQLQIDTGTLRPSNGTQDGYMAWSTNPGLTQSNLDATNLPEGLLAQQYTMDDNFFHASFGGSFLNHQWLVSAASPYQWDQAIPTSSLSNGVNSYVTHIGNGPAATDSNLSTDGRYAVNTIFLATSRRLRRHHPASLLQPERQQPRRHRATSRPSATASTARA